jgi:two-component system cell cycle response regulator DivK
MISVIAYRDMLSRRLARHSIETTLAADGKQGLQMAEASSPDMILLDLSLPEIDGSDVLRLLRQNPRMKHVPVIALTAHALVTDRERGLEAGFDNCDIKPIELPKPLKKIDALLNGRIPP